jgi:hypothetical protein
MFPYFMNKMWRVNSNVKYACIFLVNCKETIFSINILFAVYIVYKVSDSMEQICSSLIVYLTTLSVTQVIYR